MTFISYEIQQVTVHKPFYFIIRSMDMTLRQAQLNMTKNATFAPKVPLIIWLLENPKSPLHLPGAISLQKHDYVHCLLGANLKLDGEAFVIGFTMGCDTRMTGFHLWLFKMVSCHFYPRQYRFSGRKHWIIFKRGYDLAKQTPVRHLESFDFDSWLDKPLEQLRRLFFGEKALNFQ
ncbi:MAG: hypothetical protein EB059_09885 [Alphaproteobacteria bacterium]|nr:hypothetical protein [Alphaproteobacteria bacterium]